MRTAPVKFWNLEEYNRYQVLLLSRSMDTNSMAYVIQVGEDATCDQNRGLTKKRLRSPDRALWETASKDEIQCFQKAGIWSLRSLLSHCNMVGNQWIFKINLEANDNSQL